MKVLDFLLDLIYPAKCPFCGRITEKNAGVCGRCEKKLPVVPEALREQHLKNGVTAVSPLYYDGMVRQALLNYKFRGKISFCRPFAQIVAKTVDLSAYSCDYISWVPLSRKRLRRRGYNQAKLIAEELSRLTGMDCGETLIKPVDNPAQSGTGSRELRRENVKGVYSLKTNCDINGKRILLVDDIITTGSTLSECAGILRSGGAEIVAVTVARSKE